MTTQTFPILLFVCLFVFPAPCDALLCPLLSLYHVGHQKAAKCSSHDPLNNSYDSLHFLHPLPLSVSILISLLFLKLALFPIIPWTPYISCVSPNPSNFLQPLVLRRSRSCPLVLPCVYWAPVSDRFQSCYPAWPPRHTCTCAREPEGLA